MLSLITADNFTAWDDTVKRFRVHDVYYLASYVEAFRIHGDGTPVLLYYENLSGLSGACSQMPKSTSESRRIIQRKNIFSFF